MTQMMRILIVDDQPHNRYLVSKSLHEAGYQTVIINHPDSVWEHWCELMPEMLLINSLAEGFDSFALLLDIKKKHPKFPVLVYAIRSVDSIDKLKESISWILAKKWTFESAINMQHHRPGEVPNIDHSVTI